MICLVCTKSTKQTTLKPTSHASWFFWRPGLINLTFTGFRSNKFKAWSALERDLITDIIGGL